MLIRSFGARSKMTEPCNYRLVGIKTHEFNFLKIFEVGHFILLVVAFQTTQPLSEHFGKTLAYFV